MTEQLIKLPTEDEGFIALWKVSSEQSSDERNVLLTHGTFSNKKVLNGISQYLTEYGFTCWILEWRNHGHSSQASGFDFETIGKVDLKIALEYLINQQKVHKIDCITHSGGGICLTITLIHYPEFQSKIVSICFFACQAFGASTSLFRHYQILLGKYASKLVGFSPAKMIGGVENEPYSLMKQWFDWNLIQKFKGNNGHDFLKAMKYIKVPALSIYGEGDKFIAPAEGCERFLAGFINRKNQTLSCGKSSGYAENYSHSRIIQSQNAKKEIYPKVLDWINQEHRMLTPTMIADYKELRGLKHAYQEGGDLEDILNRLISIAKRSFTDNSAYTDSLMDLKDKVNLLAKTYREGKIETQAYGPKWDEIVRDTLMVIDQMERD
ncbi:MAG: alpha/beta fold hydrolase [Cytophagales bacterium]|nr:alpha/beta fold hydrolase [Cytophagales bacterium]